MKIKELRLKLKVLRQRVETLLLSGGRNFDPGQTQQLFITFLDYQEKLKRLFPSLFAEQVYYPIPLPSQTTDFDGRGYFTREQLKSLLFEIFAYQTLLTEADIDMSGINELRNRLQFFLDEIHNTMSVEPRLVEVYQAIIEELNTTLEDDFSKYRLTVFYSSDDEGIVYGDGQTLRIQAKTLKTRLDDLLNDTQSKKAQGAHDIIAIRSSIKNHLRASFGSKKPINEAEIRDAIENILRISEISTHKEQDRIGYSTGSTIPDLTIEELSLAIEAKLCNRLARVKETIEEINSDITAYQTRYENMLFVVYDLSGNISDVQKYTADFEKNKGVMVEVVKH